MKIRGVIALVLAAAAGLYAQQNPEDDFQTLHVRETVYMIAGAGGNITVSVGLDGVLLVDTGAAAMSDKVLAEIRRLQHEVGRRYEQPQAYGAETHSTLEAEQFRRMPASFGS